MSLVHEGLRPLSCQTLSVPSGSPPENICQGSTLKTGLHRPPELTGTPDGNQPQSNQFYNSTCCFSLFSFPRFLCCTTDTALGSQSFDGGRGSDPRTELTQQRSHSIWKRSHGIRSPHLHLQAFAFRSPPPGVFTLSCQRPVCDEHIARSVTCASRTACHD